ncbi:hypothetical protein Golob_027240 [Gossypium lobatum]|uniref:Uncharacterized protein n=1 Tax=Gossypium lobatum TaxID=34289 RepID=A0A7J8LXQ2_9ROSI|nr:hypothetical protein [Gossypium lobatum]
MHSHQPYWSLLLVHSASLSGMQISHSNLGLAFKRSSLIITSHAVRYLLISFCGKSYILLGFLVVLCVLWVQQQLCCMLPKNVRLNL